MATLTRIQVTTQPNTTTYYEGTCFDPTGMVVKAYYSNGTNQVITNYNYSPTRPLYTSDTAIEISYGGKRTYLYIVVDSNPISYITATFTDGSALYGSTLSTSSFYVTGHLLHGGTKRVYTFTMDYDWLLVGSSGLIDVTITSDSHTCQVNNIPVSPRLNGLSVYKKPDRQFYFNGELFDRAGLIAKATYICGTNHSYSYIYGEDLAFESSTVMFRDSYMQASMQFSFTDSGITSHSHVTVYKKAGPEHKDSVVEQDMGEHGKGSVNLYSGQTKYVINDFTDDVDGLLDISHIYLSEASSSFDVGAKWKLNVYQELISNGGNWSYYDKEGVLYNFTNEFSNSDGRSSIRNVRLGLDLFVLSADTVKLVDRNNNSMIFTDLTGNSGVYRLTEIHNFPSTTDTPITAFCTYLVYDNNGKLATMTGGRSVNSVTPTISFNYDSVTGLLTSLEYNMALQTTVASFEYDSNTNDLISITKTYSTVSQSVTKKTEFTYSNGNLLVEVRDKSSKDANDNYKKVIYTYGNNDKVTSYKTGYSLGDYKTTAVSYTTAAVYTTGDKEYNINTSTILESDGNIYITSFNECGVVSQYGYEGEEISGNYSYDKPLKINAAKSSGFGYYSFTDKYPTNRIVAHDDFTSGAGYWTGGSLCYDKYVVGTCCYCLPANSASTAYGSYSLYTNMSSDGRTAYLSLWVKASASAKLIVNINQNSDSPIEITQQLDANLTHWQYTSIRLGRRIIGDVVKVTIDSASPVYIDDVSIVTMPYDVPADISENEYDGFGRLIKAYNYYYSDDVTVVTEYTYTNGYLTEMKKKIDGSVVSRTVYTYTNGRLTNKKTYGTTSDYLSESYVYTSDALTQTNDVDNVTVNYSEGAGYKQQTTVGTATYSPDSTVRNEYYTGTEMLKNVISGTEKNNVTYNANGDPLKIKYAYSGTNNLNEDVFDSEYNFVYDTFGNISEVKIGNDTLTTFVYDSKHLESVTYGNGDGVAFVYDSKDRLVTINTVDPADQTTLFAQMTYSADGKTVTVTHSNGFEYENERINKNLKTTALHVKSASDVYFDAINYESIYADSISNIAYKFMNTTLEEITIEKDFNGNITNIDSNYNFTHEYAYDELQRLQTHIVKAGSRLNYHQFVQSYTYKTPATNRTTTQVDTDLITIDGVSGNSYQYYYHANGNLSTIKFNNTYNYHYYYDSLNRLVRENNPASGVTFVYTYNKAGNIASKTLYLYTTGTPSNPTATYNYTYDTTRKDKLLSFGNDTISYDAYGNPTSYRGKTMTWNGRRMISCNGTALAYDYRGLRVKKGNKEYFWVGNNLKAEYDGTNAIYYYYDSTGICGMNLNGTKYWFRKNAFGTIMEIFDMSGTLLCMYAYDAWGNHMVLNPDGTENTSSTFIGNINPIRYRGYYWDSEFNLYYLQSRYYDSETARFISPDSTQYLDNTDVQGLNLYTYCNNNPVMYVDPEGTFWGIIGIIVVISLLAICLVSLSGDSPQEQYKDDVPESAQSEELSNGRVVYYSSSLVDEPSTSLKIYNSFDYSDKELKEFLNILINKNNLKNINISRILTETKWHKIAYLIGYKQQRTASVDVYFDADDVGHWVFSWIINNLNLWGY